MHASTHPTTLASIHSRLTHLDGCVGPLGAASRHVAHTCHAHIHGYTDDRNETRCPIRARTWARKAEEEATGHTPSAYMGAGSGTNRELNLHALPLLHCGFACLLSRSFRAADEGSACVRSDGKLKVATFPSAVSQLCTISSFSEHYAASHLICAIMDLPSQYLCRHKQTRVSGM